MKLLLYWMVVLTLVLICRNEPTGLDSSVGEKLARGQKMNIPVTEEDILPVPMNTPERVEELLTYEH